MRKNRIKLKMNNKNKRKPKLIQIRAKLSCYKNLLKFQSKCKLKQNNLRKIMTRMDTLTLYIQWQI